MKQLNPTPSLSLKELRLLPGFTHADCSLSNIDLATRLCRKDDGFLTLSSPFVSAAMQAVTNDKLATALALLGGVGVIPIKEDQVATVKKVKQFKAGFQTDILTVSPEHTLLDLLKLMQATGFSTFPVTDSGLFHGRLLGIITDKDFDVRKDLALPVAERMRTDIQMGVDIESLSEANALMIKHGRGFLPIVSEEHTLKSVVFKKDLDHHLHHPLATEDQHKRLMVGAAISTHPNNQTTIDALIDAEVDFLVIDASDGFTHYQADTLQYIKRNHQTPVIAGNVVTAEGFQFLANAGADAIKVGMGIGSGCTTQEAKATGRGQATALMSVVEQRDEHFEKTGSYLPVIADGSINSPAEICIALALGADSVMMGNYFARCTESPGKMISRYSGNQVQELKEYWMEGSRKAQNNGRYFLGNESNAPFFEEGVSGWVPHAGSIFDVMPVSLQRLKSSLSTAGCRDIKSLHQEAILERQSTASIDTSQVRNMFLDGPQ